MAIHHNPNAKIILGAKAYNNSTQGFNMNGPNPGESWAQPPMTFADKLRKKKNQFLLMEIKGMLYKQFGLELTNTVDGLPYSPSATGYIGDRQIHIVVNTNIHLSISTINNGGGAIRTIRIPASRIGISFKHDNFVGIFRLVELHQETIRELARTIIDEKIEYHEWHDNRGESIVKDAFYGLEKFFGYAGFRKRTLEKFADDPEWPTK